MLVITVAFVSPDGSGYAALDPTSEPGPVFDSTPEIEALREFRRTMGSRPTVAYLFDAGEAA